jgi:type II secretory pathway pseudopilin PulG
MPHQPIQLLRGSILIETMVGISIFALIFSALLATVQLVVTAQIEQKAKIGGTALATEGIEKVRSLAYSSVGVVGGNPSGTLPASETVTLNNITYTRTYTVSYVDDPHDGLAGSDTNAKPNDYKRVSVKVTWTARNGLRSAALSSFIMPQGIEP